MKNTMKIPGIIVFVAIMAFAFTACEGPQGRRGLQGPEGPQGPEATLPGLQPGIWFESAYAEWIAREGDDQFFAQIMRNDQNDWQNVDNELVRLVDAERNIWRVDVPGLRNTPGTSYDLRVLNNSGTVVHLLAGLVPQPFDRQGYAFSLHPESSRFFTSGGYNRDGTVPNNAEIIYLTHENMNEVLTAGRFNNRSGPTIIRVIGRVGRLTTPHIPGPNLLDTSELPNAITGARMFVINASNNLTIEGIGYDAYIEGWGINIASSSNVVVRNLRFDWWWDDGIHLQGIANNNLNASHTWIAHNSFGYGVNRYAIGQGEADHVKGDGATDINRGATHFTVSYNLYLESGKSMLIGGGVGQGIGHGTIHHNLFYRTDERTPRLRNGWVHVFNNIYDHVGGEPGGGSGYGIGAGHRSNIVSEGNTFIRTFRPYVISGGFSGHAAGPNPDGNINTLSNDAPGIIITSRFANARALTGRNLVPDSLDAWSINSSWFSLEELTMPGGVATITNSLRGVPGNETWHNLELTYTFVPFHIAMNFRTDGTPGTAPQQSPDFNFAAARAPINSTLSAVGVQSAAAGYARVRQFAGPMRAPVRE